jgi:hypothetical protein
MTSVVLEARNIDVLKPVIDFAKSCGVSVKFNEAKNKKTEIEAFQNEKEALDFCNDVAMEWLDDTW